MFYFTKYSISRDGIKNIVFKNVVILVVLHVLAVYSLFVLSKAKWETLLFTWIVHVSSGLGLSAGVHRLWSHRAYKARLPLKIFLLICNTVAIQASVWEWSRDHRAHHKFTDTDADPYNSRRGFFFSHVGWLMTKKHRDVIEKGKTVVMSDLESDPHIMFQKRYYLPLILTFGVLLPTLIPVYFWQENLLISYLVCFCLRYVILQNSTWLVNSAAHMWGWRPYNGTISGRENSFVSFLVQGEGYHNYHHTFPWDYATSELGLSFNFAAYFIKTMEFLGLAYDLKTTSSSMVQNRLQKTSDASNLQEDNVKSK